MSGALRFLLSFAISASAAIALALALTALLRQKASARSLYIAWLAVLAAALIPVRLLKAPAPVALPAPSAAVSITRPAVTAQPRAARLSVPAATPAAAVPARRMFSAQDAALTVYVLGVAASLGVQLGLHARYMRRLRRWRVPPRDSTAALYHLTGREMGLRRLPALYICPAADTPMAAGLIRACVYLPDENLTPEETRLIFRHELTHCRRGDLAVKALTLLAVAAHWYNPLIYLMRRGLDYACEASCDEQVMRGQDLAARAYYSETIVAVIRRKSRMRTALSTTFYGGKKGMKNRILSIMNTGKRRLGALVLCPVLLAASLGVAFANEPQTTLAPSPIPSPTPVPLSTSMPTPLPLSTSMPTPVPLSTSMPTLVPSASMVELFHETGSSMSAEQARQKALELYQSAITSSWRVDDSALVNYEVKPVNLAIGTYTVAVVDIGIIMSSPEGASREQTWRAYLTPVKGEPLMLRFINEDGQESMNSYWLNPRMSEEDPSGFWWKTLPAPAVVSAAAGGANLCLQPTDYFTPMGVLLNGTEVIVDEVSLLDNNVPELTDSKLIYWGYVSVGSIGGWVPMMTLTLNGDSLPQYTGRVQADTATGFVPLYDCCDEKGQVLTAISGGSDVRLLGRFARYYLVQDTEGAVGFLPLDNLLPDENSAARLSALLPEHFDRVQPGRLSFFDYLDRLNEFYDRYGDPNDWTLEQAAQVSQFRQGYAYDADLVVHILPASGDLPQERAEQIARDTVLERYGIGTDDIVRTRVSFYYMPDDEAQTHLWKIRFSVRAGLKDCSVTVDPQGQAVQTWQDTIVNRVEEAPDQGEAAQDDQEAERLAELEAEHGPFYSWTVEEKARYAQEIAQDNHYALPDESAISQDQALALARQALIDQAGLSMEELGMYHPFFAFARYQMGDQDRGFLWRVDFYTQSAMTTGPLDGYIVWLDPLSGEVVDLWDPSGNG